MAGSIHAYEPRRDFKRGYNLAKTACGLKVAAGKARPHQERVTKSETTCSTCAAVLKAVA